MVAGSSSLGSSPPSRQGSCTFPAIWLHSLNLLRSSPLGSGHCFGKTGSSTPNHHSAARSIYGCILAITTTRSPFQPSRVSFTERQVTFRRRDSAHNNQQKLMTLSLDQFLRVSCCICFPKASPASVTSGFLPTATHTWRHKTSCTTLRQTRRTPPPPATRSAADKTDALELYPLRVCNPDVFLLLAPLARPHLTWAHSTNKNCGCFDNFCSGIQTYTTGS